MGNYLNIFKKHSKYIVPQSLNNSQDENKNNYSHQQKQKNVDPQNKKMEQSETTIPTNDKIKDYSNKNHSTSDGNVMLVPLGKENFSVADGTIETRIDQRNQQDHSNRKDLAVHQTGPSSSLNKDKNLSNANSLLDKETSKADDFSIKKCDNDQQVYQDGNDVNILSGANNISNNKKITTDVIVLRNCDDNEQQDHQDGNDSASANIHTAAPSSSFDKDAVVLSDTNSPSDKQKSTTDNSSIDKCNDKNEQGHTNRNNSVSDIYKPALSSLVDKEKSTTDNSLIEKSDNDQQVHQDGNDDSTANMYQKDANKEEFKTKVSLLEKSDDNGQQDGKDLAFIHQTVTALPSSSIKNTNNLLSTNVSNDNDTKEEYQQINDSFASQNIFLNKPDQEDDQDKNDSASKNDEKLPDKYENNESKNDENNKNVLLSVTENKNFNSNEAQSNSEDIDLDNTEMKIISLDDKFTFNPKKLNLDKKSVEYINAIMREAEKYKKQVESFSNTNTSMEHFILDENLMQLVDHLDKIKCKKGDEQYAQKIAALKYIQKLQDKLDNNTIPEEKTT